MVLSDPLLDALCGGWRKGIGGITDNLIIDVVLIPEGLMISSVIAQVTVL